MHPELTHYLADRFWKDVAIMAQAHHPPLDFEFFNQPAEIAVPRLRNPHSPRQFLHLGWLVCGISHICKKGFSGRTGAIHHG